MNLSPSSSGQNAHAALQIFQQKQAYCIIFSALTSVTWDWILSLAEEYWVFKRCGPSISMIAYFLARISALNLCIFALVFRMGPPAHASCATIFAFNSVWGVTGAAAKSYLFLLRVCAVHDNSKLVALLFGLGWLAVVGARLTIPFVVRTSRLEPVGGCFISGPTSSWNLLALWVNLAFDTFVFVSISVRLVSHAAPASKHSYLSLFRGRGLPRIMNHLLREGQLFYLTCVVFSLIASIIGTSFISPILRGVFPLLALAAEINMACKVFRATVIDSVRDKETGSAQSNDLCTTLMPTLEHGLALGPQSRASDLQEEEFQTPVP